MFDELDILIDLNLEPNSIKKLQIQCRILESIISSWSYHDDISINTHIFTDSYESNKHEYEHILISNSIEYFSQSFELTNKTNNYTPNEPNLKPELIDKIYKLNEQGIKFEFANHANKPIELISDELVIPMCCQGKNRSQFLFYYLKYLEKISNISGKRFFTTYPTSGNEFVSLLDKHDYPLNNHNILGGFVSTHKSDAFSKVIGSIYNCGEKARSPHIFDKLLKIPQEYLPKELVNMELHKYKSSKYNIFDLKSSDSEKIKRLYKKYLFNLTELENLFITIKQVALTRITWICCSDESFINLINLIFEISFTSIKPIQTNNIRIVYNGTNDIFQGSNIKSNILEEYFYKIKKTFICKYANL